MNQGCLFTWELTRPDGELVVNYGGGVNTIAVLLALADRGIRPTAITMADPGSERGGTTAYRDEIMQPWCARVGFPPIVTLERRIEGLTRPRAWRLETLRDELMRLKNLPSIAYGRKSCSAKYKGEPQRWWVERQSWAQEAWAAGRKVIRVVGYDVEEGDRVEKSKDVAWRSDIEAQRFGSWHPLHELGMTRADCVRLIGLRGLPIPPKSACTYCPSNALSEWDDLRESDPVAFADAVAMSRNAKVDAPDRVGLMLCNPHGKRQLHVWADGGYSDLPPTTEADEEDARQALPCECAT